MRRWLAEKLPAIDLLYARMGDSGPAGLTFAGQDFGPTIVLNLEGKNTNPCVRRFSLAHEVYHVLADWDRTESLAILSGYVSDVALEREQRANAFATRLLCPEADLQALATKPVPEIVQLLITKWGLHYAAAQLYIKNEINVQPPRTADPQWATGADDWSREEDPEGLAFPLASVAAERRTLIARFAAHAYSQGLIQRDRFAEYLGVPPTEDLEIVLRFFDVDLPQAA
jgi:Zn-dependent peptidase ImmA (M78 family)